MTTSQLYPLHLVSISSELLTIGHCCIRIVLRASGLAHPYMFVEGGEVLVRVQHRPLHVVCSHVTYTLQSDVCRIRVVECVRCVCNSWTCVDLNTLSTSALHKTCTNYYMDGELVVVRVSSQQSGASSAPASHLPCADSTILIPHSSLTQYGPRKEI